MVKKLYSFLKITLLVAILVTLNSYSYADAPDAGNIGNISTDKLSVYPNPVKDILTVELYSSYKGAELSISNLIGVVVYKKTIITDKVSVDMSEFSSGIYILKYTEGNSLRQTIKLVKQ